MGSGPRPTVTSQCRERFSGRGPSGSRFCVLRFVLFLVCGFFVCGSVRERPISVLVSELVGEQLRDQLFELLDLPPRAPVALGAVGNLDIVAHADALPAIGPGETGPR